VDREGGVVQWELFKPARQARRKERQKDRALVVPVGQTAYMLVPNEEVELGKSKDLAELISQLEESKFVRLFRYLVDSHNSVGMGGFDIGEPAVPLDLPDAELQFKFAGSNGSMGSYTSAWLFQIAHAPAFLGRDEFTETFVCERLRQAFANLAKMSPKLQSAAPYTGNVPHTAFHSASEGCDSYYLFTNICQDISEKALEKFSDAAHRLFGEIVGVPRDRHPAFGIGTPETVLKYAERDTRQFVLDLLNIPSDYYFVAREGRISVVPVTEHGDFLARNAVATTGVSTVATSVLPYGNGLERASFSDLEALINSPTTREQDLQHFFASNTGFLFTLDERYCEIRPHVCLFDGKGERLIPDFMARIQDSNIWNMIELKLPQSSTTVCSRAIEKASAVAARGIAELLRYRDFFSTRENRNRVSARFGTAPYEPCLVLVIGRGRRTQRYEWNSTRAGFPRVRIVSYDYVFERAEQLCRHMDHLNPDGKSRSR
jgi:hypothetical protein